MSMWYVTGYVGLLLQLLQKVRREWASRIRVLCIAANSGLISPSKYISWYQYLQSLTNPVLHRENVIKQASRQASKTVPTLLHHCSFGSDKKERMSSRVTRVKVSAAPDWVSEKDKESKGKKVDLLCFVCSDMPCHAMSGTHCRMICMYVCMYLVYELRSIPRSVGNTT